MDFIIYKENKDILDKIRTGGFVRLRVDGVFTTIDEVKELLDKYNVEYIYIGGCEREKFGGNINYDNLLELCYVWYPEDYVSPRKTITFILKVKR